MWSTLFSTHFSAIMGYGFGFIMIAFLATIDGHRFDALVDNLVPAWFASIITYISIKVIGIKDPDATTVTTTTATTFSKPDVPPDTVSKADLSLKDGTPQIVVKP